MNKINNSAHPTLNKREGTVKHAKKRSESVGSVPTVNHSETQSATLGPNSDFTMRNAATVKDSDNSQGTVATVPTVKHHGGAREGAGRPKGSSNKLTAKMLLDQVSHSGMPFEESLAQDYINSANNAELRFKYNQLFLNKVMADLKHIEIDETSTVEHRQHAFLKALETIGTVALQQEQSQTIEAKVLPKWEE